MVVTICSEEGAKLGSSDGPELGKIVGNNDGFALGCLVGTEDGSELGESVGIVDTEGANDGFVDGEVLKVGCADG